jgi:hypothetical protein
VGRHRNVRGPDDDALKHAATKRMALHRALVARLLDQREAAALHAAEAPRGHEVRPFVGEFHSSRKYPSCHACVWAEISGTNNAHVSICSRMFASHAIPAAQLALIEPHFDAKPA